MKHAFTVGAFDCIDPKATHLIRNMYKAVAPDGKVFVIILDDASIFKITGKFPTQPLNQRVKNLNYLVNKIVVANNLNLKQKMQQLIDDNPEQRIIYVAFQSKLEIAWIKLLKEFKFPIKFIKYYSKYNWREASSKKTYAKSKSKNN